MAKFFCFENAAHVYFIQAESVSGLDVNKEERKVTLFFDDGKDSLELSLETYNSLKIHDALPASFTIV